MLYRLDHGPKIFVSEKTVHALLLLIIRYEFKIVFCYRLNRINQSMFDKKKTLFSDRVVLIANSR